MGRLAAIILASAPLLAACDEAPATVADKAKLRLEIVRLSYDFRDGRHTYKHDRRFVETGGVGVTITRGKVCVRNGGECADALVEYRIDPSQTLVQKDHYVATPDAKDTITVQYWAKDDAGNALELRKVLKTDGENVVVE